MGHSQGQESPRMQRTGPMLRPRRIPSAERIDSPAAPLQTDGKGNGSWTKDDQFIMTGINFPTTGCWEVTGRYENDELTFVVWVSP